jgi:hypothetical protein
MKLLSEYLRCKSFSIQPVWMLLGASGKIGVVEIVMLEKLDCMFI